MKSNIIITVLLSGLLLPGCKKWLDVKPKTQIESSDLFNTESGYKDALFGIYTNMSSPSMYGREMTFGTVDVIGQAYQTAGANAYSFIQKYDYAHASAEAIIAGIWTQSYNTIANVNNLISELADADTSIFQKDNYRVILGEALALRAYIHFDLLRLFAPSYIKASGAPAIPYVKEFTYNTTSLSTVSEALDKVLADLGEAEKLLKSSDPIITGRIIAPTEDNGFLYKRQFHLNYFAVKATQARALFYKGSLSDAALAADEVLVSGEFPWIKIDAIAPAQEYNRDRTYSTEQIFALDIQLLEDYISLYLGAAETANSSSNLFLSNLAHLDLIYPPVTNSTDYRRIYSWSTVVFGTANSRANSKLFQPENMPVAFSKRMPMIRIPEMLLISAEAKLDADLAESCDLLNELRLHRGVSARVSVSDGKAFVEAEIQKEYLREFICEGVMFYNYKRKDAPQMTGASAAMDKSKYVLPIPIQEIEYGQR